MSSDVQSHVCLPPDAVCYHLADVHGRCPDYICHTQVRLYILYSVDLMLLSWMVYGCHCCDGKLVRE